jgi:hypothetical protein
MMTRLAVWGVFAAPLLVGGAVSVNGHAPPQSDPTAVYDTLACRDTLHATDSVSALVKMTVKPLDPKTTLPPDFEELFVQEFRARLKVPSNLALTVMDGWAPCDTVAGKCLAGVLIFGSQAYVTAHRNGTLSRIRLIDGTLTPVFADSVAAVLKRFDTEKLIPSFGKSDSVPLDIAIEVEQNPDSIPASRHLFRATIPRFNTQFNVAQYPKDAGGPKYPPIAASQKIGDTVEVAFTVLPDGSVETDGVDVLKGRYRDFIRAVFDKLATTRYVPARIGNCAVATRDRQKFVFIAP